MGRLIKYQTAQKRIFGTVKPLPVESVNLDAAPGLVLAEDIAADRDYPPFHRSAMDGYALKAADIKSAPTRLRLVGEVLPGEEPRMKIEEGQAARIMTGAKLPTGANAVQIVEVCREDDGFVEVGEAVHEGANISPQGEYSIAGDVLLRSGTMITPAVVALLASVGKIKVKARRPPLVAIGVTGDEVIPPDRDPSQAQIRNANGPAVAARLRQVGVRIRDFGIVCDDEESISALLREARAADALVLTGGVSMGRYDLVKRAFEKAGAEFVVEKVAIKPGKPFTFVTIDGWPVFALPGNPVSCLVTTELFLIPAFSIMRGIVCPELTLMRAELKGRISSRSERTTFLPARLGWEEGVPFVKPLEYHGSGDFVHFAVAEALIVVPSEVNEYDKASVVDVIKMDGSAWRSG